MPTEVRAQSGHFGEMMEKRLTLRKPDHIRRRSQLQNSVSLGQKFMAGFLVHLKQGLCVKIPFAVIGAHIF